MTEFESWSLWITGAGVSVAIGVLVVYICQLKAMQGQLLAAKVAADAAKISAEALKALERADVLLSAVFLYNEVAEDQNIVFEFKNVGRSRATYVSVAVMIYASTEPGHIDYNAVGGAVLLAPDQLLKLTTARLRKWLTETALKEVDAGLLDLRFRADIQYGDVFQKKTVLKFMGMFDSTRRSFAFDQEDASEGSSNPG